MEALEVKQGYYFDKGLKAGLLELEASLLEIIALLLESKLCSLAETKPQTARRTLDLSLGEHVRPPPIHWRANELASQGSQP
jgi:hypothetical protein